MYRVSSDQVRVMGISSISNICHFFADAAGPGTTLEESMVYTRVQQELLGCLLKGWRVNIFAIFSVLQTKWQN